MTRGEEEEAITHKDVFKLIILLAVFIISTILFCWFSNERFQRYTKKRKTNE
jgi:hypothetical protein